MKIKHFIIIAIIFLCLVIGLYWKVFTTVERGEHLQSVKWLPKEATDISFYRNYNFTAFEFTISENGFLDWARQRNREIRRVAKPFRIRRYTCIDNGRHALALFVAKSTNYNEAMQYDETNSYAVITNGYVYTTDFGQSGGGIHIAFDLDNGMAYLQSNPR